MFDVVEDGWRSFLPDQEFELLTSVVSWILEDLPRLLDILVKVVCQVFCPVVSGVEILDGKKTQKTTLVLWLDGR